MPSHITVHVRYCHEILSQSQLCQHRMVVTLNFIHFPKFNFKFSLVVFEVKRDPLKPSLASFLSSSLSLSFFRLPISFFLHGIEF